MPAPQEGTLADAIARPLDVVRALFLRAGQPAGGEDDWGVEAHFRGLMADPAALEQVPLLTPENIDTIPNNSLCRYRGMIQDMMDPEYYVGAARQPHGGWATAKFSNSPPEGAAPDAETRVWDRKPLYCTAVPGASAWCSHGQQPQPQLPQLQAAEVGGSKRPREEPADVAMADADEAAAAAAAKAPRAAEPAPASGQQQQQQQQQQAPALPGPQPGDCLVFAYGRTEEPRLNEACEFVGVLSRLPQAAQLQLALGARPPADFAEEEAAAVPPTSLVPRLHALTHARLTGAEELPLIPCKSAEQRQQQVAALRAAALQVLSGALAGDALAAEYLLLQLAARVHTRADGGGAPLGLFSLALTNCPAPDTAAAAAAAPGKGQPPPPPLGSPELLSAFGRGVLAALASLLPRVVGLPLAVDELNARTWRPARDLKSCRLLAAPLQLAAGTQVVLDETRLQAGQLTPLGVENLKALQRLAEEQTVEYDFGFYRLPMPAEAPLLLLARGRPLLHACLSVTLPLQPAAQPGAPPAALPEEVLRPVRAYLALVKGLEFAVPQPVGAWLEEQLVAARQADASLQPATMHTWLTLARLVALSRGADELAQEHWREVRRLEHLRQQRLRAAR